MHGLPFLLPTLHLHPTPFSQPRWGTDSFLADGQLIRKKKKKLMDSLIAHWLLKPPNHNSNNKRLIDVYLNTQTCKFASSLNCHMGIHSQIITNGLTYLLQGFSIIVFNGKLVKFDPDCY